jgi:lactate permease
VQLLLVAFCFGALIEGIAGFGAPVAITASMLAGLGFEPIMAAGLALIANTAPVAFGSARHSGDDAGVSARADAGPRDT